MFWACKNSQPVITSENLDKSKALTEFTIAKGDTLKIKMASNPTTGFKWEQASKIKPKVVKFINSEYKARDNKSGMIGVGGNEIWYYSAKKTGELYLHFTYKKGNEIANEKYFKITVK